MAGQSLLCEDNCCYDSLLHHCLQSEGKCLLAVTCRECIAHNGSFKCEVTTATSSNPAAFSDLYRIFTGPYNLQLLFLSGFGYCLCCIISYNIARVLVLSKSYWAVMNKIFIYTRPCVYKMTSAFFLTGCRVSVLLSCSAVFLLFKIWKKPAKNCPIFLSALTFQVLIQRAVKIKPKKTLSCAFANLNKNVACFWPANRHVCLLLCALWEFFALSQ